MTDDREGPTSGAQAPSATAEQLRLEGRYELLGLLGSGGMGSVFRARDLELDEIVAVKFLRQDIDANPVVLDRFRLEAKLARRVTHKNVARTFDISEHQGQRFLTMEYVDGESLGRVLLREGALPASRLVELGIALCDGLAAAHAAGVVHRDLKPENVMLERTGRVVITDFGIAHAKHDGNAVVAGTPAYMAPEQFYAEADVDGRADLFALGAVLFEMATGVRAWPGETLVGLMAARLSGEPPDPRALNPGVPERLAACIRKCMATRPEDRFADAEHVAAELRGALAGAHAFAGELAPNAAVRALRVAPAPMAGDMTVAVLPLRNAGAADDAWMADELTDELIDALSNTSGIRVRPRGSGARPTDADAREIGRTMGVEVVVDGSVRRSDASVRINARMISVAEGFQLWAKRFERAPRDLLAVVDDLASDIAAALSKRSVPRGSAAPNDAAAVDLYLRARHALRSAWWGGDLGAVVVQFEEALAKAPDDPSILSGYALARARLLNYAKPKPGEREATLRVAERAIEAAPRIGESWLSLAMVYYVTSDWPAAVRAVRAALHRAPGLLEAQSMLALVQAEVGRLDEALFRLETLQAIDPSRVVMRTELARIFALKGMTERSEALLEAPAEREPENVLRMLVKVRLASWQRRTLPGSDALATFPLPGFASWHHSAIAFGVVPPEAGLLLKQRIDTAAPGSRLRPLLNQFGCELQALAGDWERALDALEAAVDARLYDLAWLDRCALLEPMRAMPRFQAAHATVAARGAEIEAALDEANA